MASEIVLPLLGDIMENGTHVCLTLNFLPLLLHSRSRHSIIAVFFGSCFFRAETLGYTKETPI